MVLFKSTAIVQKKEGINKASERFETQKKKLNEENEKIIAAVKLSIEKKRFLKSEIETLIERMQKEKEVYPDNSVDLMLRIKDILDEDIKRFAVSDILNHKVDIKPISELNLERLLVSDNEDMQ